MRAGQPMSYTVRKHNNDECVKDNVTGLLWEQKTTANKDNTYTWDDTAQHINALNAANYCGYSDWRLPTREELMSIIDYGRYNPAINSIFTNISSDGYWSTSSSVRYQGYPQGYAWYVSFNDDSFTYTSGKSSHLGVRAVRPSQ